MPTASSSSLNAYADALTATSDEGFAQLVLALKFEDATFRSEAMSRHQFRIYGGRADTNMYCYSPDTLLRLSGPYKFKRLFKNLKRAPLERR